MFGKQVVTVGRIGTEHLSGPLRTKPLSAPALLFGTPDSYEEYKIAVLTVGT